MKLKAIFCLLLVPTLAVFASEGTGTRPVIGLHDNPPRTVALVGADVMVEPGVMIEDAVLIVKGDKIVNVGQGLTVPPEARVIDVTGQKIYPGFIDLYSHYGMPGSENQGPFGYPTEPPRIPDKAGGVYWSEAVQPEREAGKILTPSGSEAETLRAVGFTTVLSHPKAGIFRGSSALTLLGSGSAAEVVFAPNVAQSIALENQARGVYPASDMGVIALIRQVLSDAEWYSRAVQAYWNTPNGQDPVEVNLALEALSNHVRAQKAVIFHTENEREALRAGKLAAAFGLNAWIVESGGSAYRRAETLKQAGSRLILTANLPQTPDVTSPEDATDYSLRDLRHYYFAPENPRMIAEAGIPFTITADGMRDKKLFLKNLRKMVDRGLDPQKALAALTTEPAAWLGMDGQLGKLSKWHLANFIVTDGDLFDKNTKIMDTWVAGERFEINPQPTIDPRGKWALSLNSPSKSGILTFKGEPSSLKGELAMDGADVKLKHVKLQHGKIWFTVPGEKLKANGLIRFDGIVDGKTAVGTVYWPDGWTSTWTAAFDGKTETDEAKEAETEDAENKAEDGGTDLGLTVVYPDGAFGRAAQPEQPASVLVKNATIWTSGPAGILTNADLLIVNGKIEGVGQNLSRPSMDTVIIDAAGKHVTPGLIDAHSHIAIDGLINEWIHSISAEVGTGDVVDSDDINIYRQLAGGLTMSNLLHGSTNTIGGKNAVIKLRWGADPEAMKFEHAMPGIKFALGENVKRSNTDEQRRYPQTRLGVEQFFRDQFRAAMDYRQEWEGFSKRGGTGVPPRKDYRMETLLEVLAGTRQIHCHSYRQDEILALIRVADELGFKVDVFTHILEGYKVASEMANHGAMGSTFSDWWAYKFEVVDAIPYNAALMYGQNVVTSLNSDSAELARRLNTEAAKAVKYGGVPREEALKMVTLNPAKQLHVDAYTGSLEKGKDADFVIWNGDPLSTFSRCEQTWVDGRKYFDREEDLAMRKEAEQQRNRLIQYILNDDVSPGGKMKGASVADEIHCDTIHDASKGEVWR